MEDKIIQTNEALDFSYNQYQIRKITSHIIWNSNTQSLIVLVLFILIVFLNIKQHYNISLKEIKNNISFKIILTLMYSMSYMIISIFLLFHISESNNDNANNNNIADSYSLTNYKTTSATNIQIMELLMMLISFILLIKLIKNEYSRYILSNTEALGYSDSENIENDLSVYDHYNNEEHNNNLDDSINIYKNNLPNNYNKKKDTIKNNNPQLEKSIDIVQSAYNKYNNSKFYHNNQNNQNNNDILSENTSNFSKDELISNYDDDLSNQNNSNLSQSETYFNFFLIYISNCKNSIIYYGIFSSVIISMNFIIINSNSINKYNNYNNNNANKLLSLLVNSNYLICTVFYMIVYLVAFSMGITQYLSELISLLITNDDIKNEKKCSRDDKNCNDRNKKHPFPYKYYNNEEYEEFLKDSAIDSYLLLGKSDIFENNIDIYDNTKNNNEDLDIIIKDCNKKYFEEEKEIGNKNNITEIIDLDENTILLDLDDKNKLKIIANKNFKSNENSKIIIREEYDRSIKESKDNKDSENNNDNIDNIKSNTSEDSFISFQDKKKKEFYSSPSSKKEESNESNITYNDNNNDIEVIGLKVKSIKSDKIIYENLRRDTISLNEYLNKRQKESRFINNNNINPTILTNCFKVLLSLLGNFFRNIIITPTLNLFHFIYYIINKIIIILLIILLLSFLLVIIFTKLESYQLKHEFLTNKQERELFILDYNEEFLDSSININSLYESSIITNKENTSNASTLLNYDLLIKYLSKKSVINNADGNELLNSRNNYTVAQGRSISSKLSYFRFQDKNEKNELRYSMLKHKRKNEANSLLFIFNLNYLEKISKYFFTSKYNIESNKFNSNSSNNNSKYSYIDTNTSIKYKSKVNNSIELKHNNTKEEETLNKSNNTNNTINYNILVSPDSSNIIESQIKFQHQRSENYHFKLNSSIILIYMIMTFKLIIIFKGLGKYLNYYTNTKNSDMEKRIINTNFTFHIISSICFFLLYDIYNSFLMFFECKKHDNAMIMFYSRINEASLRYLWLYDLMYIVILTISLIYFSFDLLYKLILDENDLLMKN